MRSLPLALAWISALLGSASGCNGLSPGCPQTRVAIRHCKPRPDLDPTTGGTTTSTTGPSTTGTSSGTSGTTDMATSTGATATSTGAATTAADPAEICDPWEGPEMLLNGPYFFDDQCCYDVEPYPSSSDSGTDSDISVCGRPFVVDGAARVAASVEGDGWVSSSAPGRGEIDRATREALADAWLADAAAEHASIAAFARFTLQLLAVAAPAELVEAAAQAGLDEVEHARLCYGLAAAYADRPRSPGPLASATAPLPDLDLAAIVASTFLEGCVGETTGAVAAAVAASNAADPQVRRVWERIASDEGRHAALAWRFIAWALAREPGRVAATLRAARADLRRRSAHGPSAPSGDARELPGRLSRREQARVADAVLRRVIVPQLDVLLARHTGTHEEPRAPLV